MTKINIRESLKHLDEDTFCKYDLTTLYDSCVLDDKDKKLIVKMLYDKEDPEVIYQKLCMYFDDDEIAEIDEFMLDTPTQGKYESIIKKCVDKLSETYKDVKYNDVANQLEFTDGNQQFAIGLCPFTDIDTDDYELFIDYNYDTPCCFNTEQEVLKYILNFIKNKINHLDDSDVQTCDDNMVYTVYDIIEDDNRLTAKCMNESTNDFKDIKLGKIKTEKVIELINNMLNNPDYKVTDAVRQKIAKNSAPWGLAVQMAPSVDVDATNSLLSTGDFGGEVSFGESVEETFEKEDRVTDGDRQGTVLDSDSQKVLVEWDYSETDDIEWVDKSTLELVSETNSGFLPNMEYCPACGGTRFNVKTGVCIDCGYNEGDWGYTNTDDYDDLDESKNTIVTGKEARKYLDNKVNNTSLEDSKGYWKIQKDLASGGDLTIVADIDDIPRGYKYRFSFDDINTGTTLNMDAYSDYLNWYIVDYLSDVKLEESVSGRYVWFSYNDIKDVKPKLQQVIDAYNDKYPDYDNPLTGIKNIKFAGRSYPEKELHYIVTDIDGKQFWAVVGNVSKDMLDTIQESLEENDEDGWGDRVEQILEPTIRKVEDLAYEVRNTVRGANTGCDTTDELADYVDEVIEDLKDVNSSLRHEAEEIDESHEDGWAEEDINLHKSIDWESRNYMDFPVTTDSFVGEAILYGEGKDKLKNVKMIKYLVANPFYPPYYAPKENPFKEYSNVVGPMYDGRKHGSYQIHNRYETQELYDTLFESTVNNDKSKIKMFDCPRCHNKTLVDIDNYVTRNADVDYHDKFVCEECGAELLSEPQFDGTITFITESLQEEWNTEWDNIGIEIEKAARKQHIGVDFINTDSSVMGAFTATFEINNGDWKHDHLAFDSVVKKYLANNEKYALWKIDTNQIGSSDDDSYSAEHVAFIVPKNKIELLNNMKGLFAESINSANLTDCPACGDTSFDTRRGRCTKCNYKEELDKSKSIKESSDSEYWYFTKHGVQPGSIPNNIYVLEIKDTPDGTYFKGNRVLTTKELQDYEIKEKSPELIESNNEDMQDKVKFSYAVIEFVEGGNEDSFKKKRVTNAYKNQTKFTDLDKLGDLIYDADADVRVLSDGYGYDKCYVDVYGEINGESVKYHGIRYDLGDGLPRSEHLSNSDIPEIEDVLTKEYLERKQLGESVSDITLDMWYNDDVKDVDKIDVQFYDNDTTYRGNLYIGNKMVGDYSTKDSVALEKQFPQFNWSKFWDSQDLEESTSNKITDQYGNTYDKETDLYFPNIDTIAQGPTKIYYWDYSDPNACYPDWEEKEVKVDVEISVDTEELIQFFLENAHELEQFVDKDGEFDEKSATKYVVDNLDELIEKYESGLKDYFSTKIDEKAQEEASDYFFESLKPYQKEEFKKQLQDDLYDSMIELFKTPDWGYENIKEIDDFINPIVEIEDYKGDYDNDIKVELRAEVNYRELEDVCDTLDKVVRKYDKNAYFEPVQPGIAVAYLKFPKKLKEDFEDDEIVTGEQEFDSAATSINSNKLPAIYSMVDFTPGEVVIDFGGGKFDNAVNYLKDKDVTLLVYDPYNRSAEHNKEVLRVIRENGGADAAINSNVLNVIKEPEARQQVLKNIKKLVKPGAPIYITVYEGSGKGNEGPTKAGYQLNRKTSGYIDEISQIFPNVKRRGRLITAINESFSSSGLRQANIDAIDYFTEFEDIYTFPKGKFLATDWKELRDGVAMGMDDDLEIAEGIMEYLQKEIDFNNKHKEIYEDDPQAELTLEVYNKVKKEYERAVSKLGLSETLSDRIKNNELDYDEEIDAYFAEEDNIYVQFQDRQTNTYQATKNSEKGLQIFDKQPRVSSNTWGRIWKDGKLVKSFEGPKYKVRADVIKYLDDNNKSEVLEETSYGGAFDIEDDQYFTKEDIMDLADEVCERLYKEVHETFDVSDLYMEGNTLHMELESDSCVVYTDVKIDMRKIRKPLDIMKYALPITNKLLKEIKEQLSM